MNRKQKSNKTNTKKVTKDESLTAGEFNPALQPNMQRERKGIYRCWASPFRFADSF